MRILNLNSITAAATATTVNGTATDFSASPQKLPFGQGASAVLALQLQSAASATVVLQTSTDGGSTYATATDTDGNSVSVTAPILGTENQTHYFNVKSIGQLARLSVLSLGTTGTGTYKGTLLQN